MNIAAAEPKQELPRGEKIEVISPVDGSLVCEVPRGDKADIDRAATKAAGAQKVWKGLAGEKRSELLWAWASLVEQHAEAIARLDVRCTGKVIRDAIPETRRAARHARYWAGMADKMFGQQLADIPGRLSYSYRDPLGVYAVILPWNGPAHSFMARTVPALACANAVIVKPSELSPLSALRLAELAVQAGIPENVLQVVTGDGETGGHLASHPNVAGVSFTGSPGTGRKILYAAADTFKKVTLELGGKSPIVVFADADIDSAVRAVLMGVLTNAGQICAASTRLIVQSEIAAAFVEEMKRRLANLRIGDPADPQMQVGPVVCRRQYDKIRSFVESGIRQGAIVAAGGGRPAGLEAHPGLYIAPTIFTGVTPDLDISREEVFGPVLSVMEFDTEAEAAVLANDSEYGLAAYIWTKDVGRMLRMTEAIEAGVVHGNTTLVMDSGLPFGGIKSSGLGGAYGADAIDGCTQTKRVTLRMADAPLPEHWTGI